MLKSKVRAVTIATKDKDIKLSLKKISKVNRMSYSSWMSIMNIVQDKNLTGETGRSP
jgi:hypothetical protein